jgi:stage V sporulation protein D (sporulation-specific penicillin-binding protein)
MGDVPMVRNKTYHRRKICVILFAVLLCAAVLLGRLVYLMLFRGNYYSKLATDLQQRERQIKAARGKILDRNGVVLASNKSVCTISVIHNQIEDPEGVIAMLVQELGLSEETVRKRVEKYSSIEKIKSNVDKETGNRILAYGYAGVKVDGIISGITLMILSPPRCLALREVIIKELSDWKACMIPICRGQME